MTFGLRITGFQGVRPKTSPRLLAEAMAQIAANCRLTSGELVPLSEPAIVATPSTPGPLLSVYHADTMWFTWDKDVDVARSPLPGEVKFIYTGDGEPRITTTALAGTGGGGDYPTTAHVLGVPAPQTVPTVSPSGGTGTAVSRYYCYTFYSDWNEESAPSPLTALLTGKVDDTWAVSGMDDSPANSGTGTVAVAAGVTTFTNTGSVKHWLRVGDEVVIAGVTVAVTATPTADSFKVPGDFTGATTWARKQNWGTCTKRLYRSEGTTGQFQLVAEGITASTYNDTLPADAILGDELISATWQPPPTDLKNVVTLPSGALAGFSGNEVCFSEPFQPHAWPPEYRMKSRYPIVAIGVFTSGIVVGTTGIPLVILGHDPGQMSTQPAEGSYPCKSKRSMVSLGDSVGYATEFGYARIGDSGVGIMTEDSFTRDEWAPYDPSTMIAETVGGRLYIMTQNGGTPVMLIFDYLDGTGLTLAYITVTEMFADPLTGRMYISDAVNVDVREFNPLNGIFLAQDWLSKEYVLQDPVNLGAARIDFVSRYTQATYDALLQAYNDALAANTALITAGDLNDYIDGAEVDLYPVNGDALTQAVPPDVEAPGVTFTLYVDGSPLFTTVVKDTKAFRLPGGYKSDHFAFRVSGQSVVRSVSVAETMQGLKNV